MKYKSLIIFVLALFAFTACKQAETEEVPSEEVAETAAEETTDHTETFNRRLEVIRAFIKGHSDENLEAQAATLADTVKWSSARYNDGWQGKEELMAALKGYHDNFDGITYTEGIVLPNQPGPGFFSGNAYASDGTANSGANAIRCYGTWNATHTETGKAIGVKWFAVLSFNEDDKIAMFTDYWNVDGLAAQIAAD